MKWNRTEKSAKLTVVTLLLMLAVVLPCSAKGKKAGHVLVIGLDGWGSFCMEKAEMPNVKALMGSGCYTLKKRSVLPSVSAANWASMFMGAGPELHGYTQWNSFVPDLPPRVVDESGTFPTIFRVLRNAEPKADIACFFTWEGIKYLVDTLAVDYYGPMSEEKACKESCEYIKEHRPKLQLVYFGAADYVGHHEGFGSPAYYDELMVLDSYIGQIIEALKEAGIYDDTIIILTSDHGGIDKGHGGITMLEMESPFIISGKNVKKGGEFEESMMQFDLAPTIAYIFGLKTPQVWIGRPMTQVFK